GLIRNVEAAVPPDGEAAGVVEFTVAGAALAPLFDELPISIVSGDPIGGLASWEVAEGEAAVPANGNPAAARPHLNHRPQFAVSVELLHALVVEVGDEDLVGGVNGNADREVELTRFFALLAPLPEEARRGRLGSWLRPSKAPGGFGQRQDIPSQRGQQ